MIACLLVAVAATAGAAPASAKPAAVEEYVLTLPGVDRLGVNGPVPLSQRAGDAGPIGVSAEQEAAQPLLSSVGDAIVSPAGMALLLALVGSVWLALRAPGLRR